MQYIGKPDAEVERDSQAVSLEESLVGLATGCTNGEHLSSLDWSVPVTKMFPQL